MKIIIKGTDSVIQCLRSKKKKKTTLTFCILSINIIFLK